jgi:membrane carboxypeptidase/penicillin-binding protein
MVLRTGVSAFLSPRRILVGIHRDLFKIERRIVYDYGRPEPLSSLEVMVLILEDRRFFQHHGVDFISCVRELCRALLLRSHGGASTIDMQLVRTATGYRERTLRRKLYEIFLAWIIQYRYNKFEILRSYLKCAFFGSHLYGSDAAIKQIYNKYPWDELDIDESADLAAMLVYPRPLSPTAEWTRKLSRRANYAKRLYPRLKQRFHKLPRPEML